MSHILFAWVFFFNVWPIMNIERDPEVPTLRIHCTCRSYAESLNLDNSTRNMYNSYKYCIRTLHMPYQAGKLRLQHLLSFPGLITRDLIPQTSQGGKRLGYIWSRCQALEDWVVRVIVFGGLSTELPCLFKVRMIEGMWCRDALSDLWDWENIGQHTSYGTVH